jgi:hypothetical protein
MNHDQPHDFGESLQKSHAAHDLPIWEQMYRQAFPDMLAMHDHRDDGYWQRAGIDRSIILRSSKQILIDEKVRGRNKITGKVYQDIAVEHVSNDRTGALGWAEKPLAADYIAYAIAPLGQGYLLPVPHFQAAWRANKDEWLTQFGSKSATNNGYKTLFCPVPVAALFKAMGQQLRLKFDPVSWEE